MTPRCIDCDVCKAEPFADEFRGEYWAFACADAKNHEIGTGIDASAALPKTAKRWCPRRKANQQHRVVVAMDSNDAQKEG